MRSRPFARATRRLVVGYLLTMGKGSEDARTWAFSGLLALAVFEYQARLSRGLDESCCVALNAFAHACGGRVSFW